ncbi:MAG TPA: flagellar biosynthetic protein FliR [Candidatus Acidoferrales bacterium]|jgi:flagellar biosynthetic protein FliR|nr:flagellar biosynthetic protein FliR [Candidatus Acidoferrales bacterium]
MEFDFYNWMLAFVRVGAFLLALPFFSAVNFPVMMRIALAALAALMISPQLPAFSAAHLDLFSLIGLMFREVSIGLLLGFMGRIIFYAVDIAGMIIASELGLSMGQIFDPASHQSEQVPGVMLSLLAILTMLTLDLHHGLLLGFAKTFEVLPIGGGHLSPSLFELVVGRTAQIFSVALQIAAPVMAVSFVITVFFSIMSRAVPQMNVFAESFGIRIAGGLIVFGFTLQISAQYVANHLRRIPEDLVYIGQLLNGG